MDARDRLRRYLEQRRELGETELVLDGLTVEEALRILGAKGASASKGDESATRASSAARPSGAAAGPQAEAPMMGDWRQALREAGAAPDTITNKKPAAPLETPAIVRPPDQPPAARADSSTTASSDVLNEIPSGLSVGAPGGELFGSLASLRSLEEIAAHVASCTRCPLYSTATNPVPGEGNPDADFMCVGEAPGATEDETGRPFVGAAGQLLTKILGAIDLRREDVYICNVLKHRPPGNRNPRPEEVTACSPYLIRQIELIRPKVILALGTFAAQTLLETKLSIGKLRSQIHRYYGVPLIVTYHPAALLRNPSWKRPAWEDVKLARRILDSAPIAGA
jgi:uracil-DNA glycosylase family 4